MEPMVVPVMVKLIEIINSQRPKREGCTAWQSQWAWADGIFIVEVVLQFPQLWRVAGKEGLQGVEEEPERKERERCVLPGSAARFWQELEQEKKDRLMRLQWRAMEHS
jgi:hypothetical protein